MATHNTRLGNLLGSELPLRGQVLAVVVTQVVVRRDGQRLDTSIDQKLCQNRLDLGLTRLEVVTTDERVMLLSKLDTTGNESVLGRTVDERDAFKDRGDGKDGRGGNFVVRLVDRLEERLGGIVDSGDDVGVSLSVGGPEHNDAVELVVSLERSNVVSNVLEMSSLVITWNQVVGSIGLVGSDEVGVYYQH